MNPDVYILILCHVSPFDVRSVRLVCRLFREIADRFLVRCVRIPRRGYGDLRSVMEWLSSLQRVQHLALDCSRHGSTQDLFSTIGSLRRLSTLRCAVQPSELKILCSSRRVQGLPIPNIIAMGWRYHGGKISPTDTLYPLYEHRYYTYLPQLITILRPRRITIIGSWAPPTAVPKRLEPYLQEVPEIKYHCNGVTSFAPNVRGKRVTVVAVSPVYIDTFNTWPLEFRKQVVMVKPVDVLVRDNSAANLMTIFPNLERIDAYVEAGWRAGDDTDLFTLLDRLLTQRRPAVRRVYVEDHRHSKRPWALYDRVGRLRFVTDARDLYT